MKKMICFVLVSFLGVMFSLGSASREERVSVRATETIYEVIYFGKVYDNSAVQHLQNVLRQRLEVYRDAFEQRGYSLRYERDSWEYRHPSYRFTIFLGHADPEYARLTIKGLVRGFGKRLIEEAQVNVSMDAKIADIGELEI
ncbi:hypothetical protein [Butyricimonas hominis]|jgi:hypothetical protein|uniref:DUF3574 domain-containing protein n=1 Tax=Butyricimonas hominis TaxID=2763032 RepID=A0ABR7CY03_9BACT|nr:hypothetical protein [Butyricimonas hominis]MBC5620040.1 hypothetical protein [Butyricimonas hominis]